MPVKTIAAEARFSPEKMAKTPLFGSERFACDVYGLLPGQSQKPHVHEASEKVYIVLEGSVRVRIGAGEHAAPEGTAAHVPAGAEHALVNAGPGRATVLVFMAPPPGPAPERGGS